MNKLETMEQTYLDAIHAFEGLGRAVIFSANERSVFYALLYCWNNAHRPEVLEQWASQTAAQSGMHLKNQFPYARKSLVEKGVIFFEKKGARGVPRYSLNALFRMESPFTD